MKSKFLDVRNCHALLPKENVGKIIHKLEACLALVNDSNTLNSSPNKSKHIIDKMVKHNQVSICKSSGRKRCYKSNIAIAIAIKYFDDSIEVKVIEEDPPIFQKAMLHIIRLYDNGSTWKIILPLQFLLKGWGDANDGYQGYVHTISHNLPRKMSIREYHKRDGWKDDFTYVGITGRNWLTRFSEHMSETKRECRYRFHKAIKDALGLENVLFSSWLEDINMTKDQAMDWEEEEVDKIASDDNGLNMIPGGYKGVKFLHKHKMIKDLDITIEEKHRATVKFIEQHPRRGIPNPFISALWESDDYCRRVIEARSDTLNFGQYIKIKALNEQGLTITQITKEVGARTERQVKDAISGKTYKSYQKLLDR